MITKKREKEKKREASDRGEKLHKVAVKLVYAHATLNNKMVTYEAWLRVRLQIQIEIANLGNTQYQVAVLIT